MPFSTDDLVLVSTYLLRQTQFSIISLQFVLGTRTQDGRMEGTHESTELCRHPMAGPYYRGIVRISLVVKFDQKNATEVSNYQSAFMFKSDKDDCIHKKLSPCFVNRFWLESFEACQRQKIKIYKIVIQGTKFFKCSSVRALEFGATTL